MWITENCLFITARSDNESEVRGRSRSGRRDDPRRHTLSTGADGQYLPNMSGQGGPLSRTMDLEVGTNYLTKSYLKILRKVKVALEPFVLLDNIMIVIMQLNLMLISQLELYKSFRFLNNTYNSCKKKQLCKCNQDPELSLNRRIIFSSKRQIAWPHQLYRLKLLLLAWWFSLTVALLN